MKAVNLLPQDLRRASGSAGATGNAVYFLLGGLGVMLVLVAAWAMASRSVAQGESDVARFRAEADAAEVRAGQLKPYAAFSAMRAKRVETVTSLSRSRFNWPFALREISRVLPENVWLTQLTGTVAPGVPVEDAPGGPTTQLRSQLSAPAIEISGCTTSQEQVASYLARLRSIQGVTRVTLASSEKADEVTSSGGGGGAGKSQDNDCRQGDGEVPKFDLIIFFEASTASPSTGAAPTSSTPTAAPGASK
jgi:Tfp pilus assembly protein PilN